MFRYTNGLSNLGKTNRLSESKQQQKQQRQQQQQENLPNDGLNRSGWPQGKTERAQKER